MVVITILYIQKVTCHYHSPFMVLLPLQGWRCQAFSRLVWLIKSALSAKIYNSVDTDKRRSEKNLFENANFLVIPCSRCHHGCKNQTFTTKKAWRDELSWQRMRSCLACKSATPLLVSNSPKIRKFSILLLYRTLHLSVTVVASISGPLTGKSIAFGHQ